MNRVLRRANIWGLAAVVMMPALCQVGSTASIFDWLCGRRDRDNEVVVGYPVCPPAVCYDPCDPCAPPVVCQPSCPPATATVVQPTPAPVAPSTEYGVAPIIQTPAPARVPAPRAVPRINPIPQTYYRTVWKQVPVTSYRPVVSADPVTGCPVTVMKPCTTYQWQATRQRQGFFRRLFNRLCPSRDPVPVAAATPSYCVPTTCVPTTIDGCSVAPPTTMAPAPAPMQAAPAPAGTPAPAPAPYYERGPAPRTAPGVPGPAPAPGSPPATPGGTAPADQRPRLEPGDLSNTRSSSRAPLTGDGMVRIPWRRNQGGVEQTPERSGASRRGPAASEAGKRQLRPVPDPDAPDTHPSLEAPQLLNPRDRVARHTAVSPGSRTPIIWPAVARRTMTERQDQRPDRRYRQLSGASLPLGADSANNSTISPPRRTGRSTVEPTQQPARSQWDDSGWRSLRP
jgi:hypothetical protein